MNESASDKAITKLTDNIDQLVKAVQKVAPHAWETMVHQVVLYSLLQIAGWILTCVTVIVLAKMAFRLRDAEPINGKSYRSESQDVATVVCFVACGCAAIAAFLMAVIGGPETVSALLNPEYVAAMQILQVVR